MLPSLPSNEKNSFDHSKILHSLASQKALLIPYLLEKFPKNHITSSYHKNLPKTTKAIFGHQRALGVKLPDS